MASAEATAPERTMTIWAWRLCTHFIPASTMNGQTR